MHEESNQFEILYHKLYYLIINFSLSWDYAAFNTLKYDK